MPSTRRICCLCSPERAKSSITQSYYNVMYIIHVHCSWQIDWSMQISSDLLVLISTHMQHDICWLIILIRVQNRAWQPTTTKTAGRWLSVWIILQQEEKGKGSSRLPTYSTERQYELHSPQALWALRSWRESQWYLQERSSLPHMAVKKNQIWLSFFPQKRRKTHWSKDELPG